MIKVLPRNKTSGSKRGKIVRTTKLANAKSRANSRSSHAMRANRHAASHGNAKSRNIVKTKDRISRKSKHPVLKEGTIMEPESKRPTLPDNKAPAIGIAPRLLRETKTTSAALALLEKSIRSIYQRDFKKARSELQALLEMYPGEREILARARSYIQICDREEASREKLAVPDDQLYTLGVMEHNKANYDAAISYFYRWLENHPESDYVYYSLAASMAMNGDLANAIKYLRKAIRLNEASRVYARNDADFSSLQAQKEFADLIGISPSFAIESQQ